MFPRFGIKVGNSTLCIATTKSYNGNVEVIANKQGDRVSHACIMTEGDDEIECGLTAKQKMYSKPHATVANSFQFMMPQKELVKNKMEKAVKIIPCQYDPETNKFILISKNTEPPTEKHMTPVQVFSHLFKAEFELAKQHHLEDDKRPIVVISMPVYYPKESSKLISEAAEKAGFHVGQIIYESTAAVLPFKLTESQQPAVEKNLTNGDVLQENGDRRASQDGKFVLCIKTGGIFTSLVLYYAVNGLYTIVETLGPFEIGGNQFTDVLIDFISKEFYKKHRLDTKESRRTQGKLRTAADNCKHILTTLPSTQLYIDSLMDGVDFNVQMTRARYEMLLQTVLADYTKILSQQKPILDTKIKSFAIDNSLSDENLEISQVILLGATMKIPILHESIKSIFKNVAMNTTQYAPDEVVAVGCAQQASYLSASELESPCPEFVYQGIHENIYLWHKTNLSGKMLVLPIGTPVPCSRKVKIPIDPKSETNDENAQVFNLLVGKETIAISVINPHLDEEQQFHLKLELSQEQGGSFKIQLLH